MPVLTGRAVGPTALLRAVSDLLEANGFLLYAASPDGTGRHHHLVRGTQVVNLRSAVNEYGTVYGWGGYRTGLALNLSTNYDRTKAWHSQPGSPLVGTDPRVRMVDIGAAADCAFWLVIEPNFVSLAIETTAGQIQLIGWGTLDKVGAYTGGWYFFAEGPDASKKTPFANIGTIFVRADVDTFTGKWLATSLFSTDASASGYTGKHAATSAQSSTAFPGFNLYADHDMSAGSAERPLLPVHVYVVRDAGGYSHIGSLPGHFTCLKLAYPTSVGRGASLRLAADNYLLLPGLAVRHSSPARPAAAGPITLFDGPLQELRGKVLPSIQSIEAGYLAAEQTTTLKLWNVDQRNEALVESVVNPDLYGVSTTAAPFAILPGASKSVSITIKLTGRPAVRDAVQFFIASKGAASPSVDVAYHRAQVFPIPPNWLQPVTERISSVSSVLEAYAGAEQRAALSSRPRQVLELTVSTADQAETQLAEALLFQGPARVFAAPRWQDARLLGAATANGATFLPVETSYGEFTAGGFAVVSVSRTAAFIVEIDRVLPTGLQLKAAAPAAFASGCRVCPALFGRLDSELPAQVDTRESADYTLTFTEEL